MHSNQPLISVIVPCYNYARYLKDLIGSLTSQSYTKWECILVDDGSVDDTIGIANSYSNSDKRIKLITQKNSGAASARNNGLKNARGQFIQFIDADDMIGPEKFKLEIDLFSSHPSIDIVYSGYSFTDHNNHKKWVDITKWQTLSSNPFNDFISYWEAGLMIPIHSFLFSKKCFENWGEFDNRLKTHEDWDLNLNFSLNGATYLYHNYQGAYYRIHPVSNSRSDLTRNRQDAANTLLKYLHHNSANRFQKIRIIQRYFEITADFFIERIIHKRIRFPVAVNPKKARALFIFAIILMPIFMFKKVIAKIIK
jgi:glycosyltransferase involved in cell wall biosynthesis